MRGSILKRSLLAIWFKVYDAKRFYDVQRSSKFSVMTPEETVAYIKAHNCSIARYGDGEFAIMLQQGAPSFQKGSGQLSSALAKAFENTSSALLICIPRFMVSTKGMNRTGKRSWKGWAIARQKDVAGAIQKAGMADYHFGDSYVSRPFTAYASSKNAEKIFPLLKGLWNDRDILIVEGEQTRLGIGNDLLANAKSVKRILAPAVNAFDRYAEILNTVLSFWNGELLLLALGPTATVLASDLSQKGIQALDLGHVDIQYEWYLRGSKSFQPISGKYTNEATDGQIVTSCEDTVYLSQIVATIL